MPDPEISDLLLKILESCSLCGHDCKVNRLAGETGQCASGRLVKVAAGLLHFGEEPPLSGVSGSGTIFFSHCPLKCVFCQNHQVSQDNQGREMSDRELAQLMIDLQSKGAHNINLVSPTPWVPQILTALKLAKMDGLCLPVVYNSGGFDSLTALGMLKGKIDVYLPDAKYVSSAIAYSFSGAKNYPQINRSAIREMFAQTGHLKTDSQGLAMRGMLVRHLVLPQDMAQTSETLAWLEKDFGKEIHISLMAQYFPGHRAKTEPDCFPELAKGLGALEYEAAIDAALQLGLDNVFIQELSSQKTYIPDFETPHVFGYTS